jgi:hypothetical protein
MPCCLLQLDKAAADAAEYKAGFDKYAADAAEYKAGYDKVSADAAELKAGFDKAVADNWEQKAQVRAVFCLCSVCPASVCVVWPTKHVMCRLQCGSYSCVGWCYMLPM